MGGALIRYVHATWPYKSSCTAPSTLLHVLSLRLPSPAPAFSLSHSFALVVSAAHCSGSRHFIEAASSSASATYIVAFVRRRGSAKVVATLHNGHRHLINSRSYDNIRMRTDLPLSETSTIHEDSPILPSPAKDHHISFRYPPPVPPLPASLSLEISDVHL